MPERCDVSTNAGNTTIGRGSRIEIGLILVLICGVVYIITAIERLNARMDAIEDKAADRFTLTAVAEQALREAVANPGHRVPDPRNPGQFFVVDRPGPPAPAP